MLHLILCSLYVTLPAYLANMAPVLAAKAGVLKRFNRPIDNGKTWRGQPIFGKNKTWRGLIAAVIVGGLCGLLQIGLNHLLFFNQIALIHSPAKLILFGILAGAGAILGDLGESFIKRRFHKEAGRPWVPWDQTDFIIGYLLLTWPVLHLPLAVIAIILVVSPLLHFLANVVGYLIGTQKVWW